MKTRNLLCILALVLLMSVGMVGAQEPVKATPGQEVNMILLPKFLGIAVFDQAHRALRKLMPSCKIPARWNFLAPRRTTAPPVRSRL